MTQVVWLVYEWVVGRNVWCWQNGISMNKDILGRQCCWMNRGTMNMSFVVTFSAIYKWSYGKWGNLFPHLMWIFTVGHHRPRPRHRFTSGMMPSCLFYNKQNEVFEENMIHCLMWIEIEFSRLTDMNYIVLRVSLPEFAGLGEEWSVYSPSNLFSSFNDREHGNLCKYLNERELGSMICENTLRIIV